MRGKRYTLPRLESHTATTDQNRYSKPAVNQHLPCRAPMQVQIEQDCDKDDRRSKLSL